MLHLEEMTNEELANDVNDDQLCLIVPRTVDELISLGDEYINLRVDHEHPLKFWKPPHHRIDPYSPRWENEQ